MKYWTRFLTAILVLSFFGINTLHAADFDFRFNLKKGEKFEYVYTSADKVDQNTQGVTSGIEQASSLAFTLKVIKKLDDGGYKLAVDYKKFVIHLVMNGNEINYNSDSVYKSNQYADLLKGFNKIHFTFDLSPVGIVTNINGMEEWTKKIAEDVRLSNLLKGIGTEEFISGLLNYLPSTTVQPGSKWKVKTILPEMKNLKYDMSYSFLESKTDQIKLGMASKIEYKQPTVANDNVYITDTMILRGYILLNPENFLPISEKVSQVSNLLITNTNPRTKVETTTPMKIETEKSLKLVSPR